MKTKILNKLRNCPKFGDRLTNYEPTVGDDPFPARDLLPAAEDCYKALGELPSCCLRAWKGQEVAKRVRNYIDALEKELQRQSKEWADYKKMISYKNHCRAGDYTKYEKEKS